MLRQMKGMKKFKIYIDNFADGRDKSFANKLKTRLQSISTEISIRNYSDLDAETEKWEEITLQAIRSADIVIPIISPHYLQWVTTPIEKVLDEIIDSTEKYLFPIYLEQSEFGSFNWIIRSKLIPSEVIPLSEYSEYDSDKVIITLIKMIKDIISKHNIKSVKEMVLPLS